jgi:hypothetical protein
LGGKKIGKKIFGNLQKTPFGEKLKFDGEMVFMFNINNNQWWKEIISTRGKENSLIHSYLNGQNEVLKKCHVYSIMAKIRYKWLITLLRGDKTTGNVIELINL